MAEYDQAQDEYFPQKLEHEIRLGFIRKTYGILCMQLALTVLLVGITVAVSAVQDFFNTYFEIFIAAIVINIVCFICLICCRNYARKVPTNYILLLVFTTTEAIMVAYVCAAYDPVTILIAAGLTLGVTVVLTLYAFITKRDYTAKMGIMLVVLFAAILFAILMGVFYSSRPAQIVSVPLDRMLDLCSHLRRLPRHRHSIDRRQGTVVNQYGGLYHRSSDALRGHYRSLPLPAKNPGRSQKLNPTLSPESKVISQAKTGLSLPSGSVHGDVTGSFCLGQTLHVQDFFLQTTGLGRVQLLQELHD